MWMVLIHQLENRDYQEWINNNKKTKQDLTMLPTRKLF